MTWLSLATLAATLCGPSANLDLGGCVALDPSSVTRVYDGDTINVSFTGWPRLFNPIGVRLLGLDTPEIRGRCEAERELAISARNRLAELIAGADQIVLADVQPDKYFRVDATLYVDGVPVPAILIDEGLARDYAGGARSGWCE